MSISAVSHTMPALLECVNPLQNGGKPLALPEKQSVDFLVKQQQQFSSHLAAVNPLDDNQWPQVFTDPQKMLAMQEGTMRAMMQIETITKVTSGITQTVNRLVTIQ